MIKSFMVFNKGYLFSQQEKIKLYVIHCVALSDIKIAGSKLR